LIRLPQRAMVAPEKGYCRERQHFSCAGRIGRIGQIRQ
jgi:hypothetical protein